MGVLLRHMAALLGPLYEENARLYSFILKILFNIPPRNLGDLMTTIFIASSFLYLRIQPQPQPISRNATRNRRNPVGKITAIRIPSPSVTAQSPSQRQRLMDIASLFLGLLHYIQRGDWMRFIRAGAPAKRPECRAYREIRHMRTAPYFAIGSS